MARYKIDFFYDVPMYVIFEFGKKFKSTSIWNLTVKMTGCSYDYDGRCLIRFLRRNSVGSSGIISFAI